MAKVIPHRTESEQSVLGSMFLGIEPLTKACDLLTKEHFYHERNGILFETLKSMYQNNIAIDIITVTSILDKEKKLSKVGGVEYLNEIVNIVPTTINLDYYIKDIVNAYLLRRLIDTAEEIKEVAYNEEAFTIEQVLDSTEKKILDVVKNKRTKDLKKASEVFDQVQQNLEFLSKNRNEVTGLNTGFIDFDKLTTGLKGGQFVIISARTGVGKTALAVNIANNVGINYKKTVAFFDIEMTAEQLAMRMLSAYSQVDSNKLSTGKLDTNDWAKLNEGISQFMNSRIYFDDTTGITIGELKSKCRKLKMSPEGLDLIIVDYLQLLSTTERYGNREQEVASISRALKLLALELEVPVIALAQLGRSAEKTKKNERPKLSDLRESGAIEQDADIVCIIHDPNQYENSPEIDKNNTVVDFIVAKHRQGPTKTINLMFIKNTSTFVNVDMRNKENE